MLSIPALTPKKTPSLPVLLRPASEPIATRSDAPPPLFFAAFSPIAIT